MGSLEMIKKAASTAVAQASLEAHDGVQAMADVLHRLKMKQHDLDHEYIARRAKLEQEALQEARTLVSGEGT